MVKRNYEDINKLAGKCIGHLRKEKELSQSELGERIGVGKGQISKIENGKTHITFSTFILINNALSDENNNFVLIKKFLEEYPAVRDVSQIFNPEDDGYDQLKIKNTEYYRLTKALLNLIFADD